MLKPGFVSASPLLSPSNSQFVRISRAGGVLFPIHTSRRLQRARIFALGAAPPPPEPQDDGPDEEEAGEPGKSDVEPLEEMTADDILSSPAFLKKKLEIVQKELIDAKKALESDSEAVTVEKDRYVRLAADFENYRRRSIEDLRKQDAKSTVKVCKEILSVLDNFERATAAVNPQTDREKSIGESYQSINKQLLDALVKLNVEPVESVGQPFDPEVHEAIQKMESTEFEEDAVCVQFQRGYKIGDILIRAAVVGVSTGPGPEGEGARDTQATAATVGEGVAGDAEEVGEH